MNESLCTSRDNMRAIWITLNLTTNSFIFPNVSSVLDPELAILWNSLSGYTLLAIKVNENNKRTDKTMAYSKKKKKRIVRRVAIRSKLKIQWKTEAVSAAAAGREWNEFSNKIFGKPFHHLKSIRIFIVGNLKGLCSNGACILTAWIHDCRHRNCYEKYTPGMASCSCIRRVT